MDNTICADNDYFIGSGGDDIVSMMPLPRRIPKDKALRLAAWIVAITDLSEGHRDFLSLLKAVENT